MVKALTFSIKSMFYKVGQMTELSFFLSCQHLLSREQVSSVSNDQNQHLHDLTPPNFVQFCRHRPTLLCKTFRNAVISSIYSVNSEVERTLVILVTAGQIKPGSTELHKGHMYFLVKCQQSVSEATQENVSSLRHCVKNRWCLVTWCSVVLCKRTLHWSVNLIRKHKDHMDNIQYKQYMHSTWVEYEVIFT